MSMGATTGSIMKIFILNGMVIGFFGSTLGTLVGLIVCYIQQRWELIPLPGDIYFINKLPVQIQWWPQRRSYLCDGQYNLFACNRISGMGGVEEMLPAKSIRID